MTNIKAKLTYVRIIEYTCESCGRVLGRDEVREGLNPSKGKFYLYDFNRARCPWCGARLEKPEVDACAVGTLRDTLTGFEQE